MRNLLKFKTVITVAVVTFLIYAFAASVNTSASIETNYPGPGWLLGYGYGGGGGGGGSPPMPGVTYLNDYIGFDAKLSAQMTAKSDDGKAKLDLNLGTTCKTREGSILYSVSVVPMSSPPAPPEGMGFIGLAYELGPEGATFQPAILLTLTYTADEVPQGVNESTLSIMVYDKVSAKWVSLPSTVDTVNHTITAQIEHFSSFAILGTLPQPAPSVTPTPTATPTSTPKPTTSTPTPTAPPTTTVKPTTPPPTTSEPPLTSTSTPVPNPVPSQVNWWLMGSIIAGAIAIATVVWLLYKRRAA